MIVKTLTFNSAFRTFGSSQNPSFIPQGIALNGVEGIRLRSIRIPLTVTNINTSNNIIRKNESGVFTNVSIIPGNYTSITFATAVQTALNSGGSAGYTVVFSSLTNKLTITNGITFFFVSVLNNAYNEIGFNDISALITNTSQISQVSIDLSGLQEINLLSNIDCIDIVNQNFNVIASVPINGSQNSIFNYSNTSDVFTSPNHSNFSEVSFQLVDHRFRVINQDLDWSVTFDFLFEE